MGLKTSSVIRILDTELFELWLELKRCLFQLKVYAFAEADLLT